MSIASVTSRHTVTILNPTESQGSQMGRNTTYTAGNTLTCTVVPGWGGKVDPLLLQRGAFARYTLYFASNPHVNETLRLRWENTVLRPVGLMQNAHGQDRLWIVRAEAHTDDNPGVEIE